MKRLFEISDQDLDPKNAALEKVTPFEKNGYLRVSVG